MTPKADFLKTPAAKFHFDLTENSNFKQAMEACLLQVVVDVTSGDTTDPEFAVARYHQIAGAVKFSRTLMNLGTKAEVPATKTTANLDHRIK